MYISNSFKINNFFIKLKQNNAQNNNSVARFTTFALVALQLQMLGKRKEIAFRKCLNNGLTRLKLRYSDMVISEL